MNVSRKCLPLLPRRLGGLAASALFLSFASATGCATDAANGDCAGGATPSNASASGSGAGVASTGAGATGGAGGGSGNGGGGSTGAGAGGGASGADAGAGGDAGIPSGRGANVPWTEFQAEDPAHATTNALVLAPTRTKWDATKIQAEAIGRQAVQLNKTGDYVEFTTTAPANSIVVRYSIPDAPGGGGIAATLGLYVNGTRVKSMNLTSKYAWSYNGGAIPGDAAGVAALNSPSSPNPHTFFDEYNSGPGDVGANLPAVGEIPAGAKVRLQRDAQDTANFYVIDLVDFEEVPAPLPMPAGFTSVTTFGIQPNDGIDHADDIQNALATVPKGLYFPPGEYISHAYVSHSGDAAFDNKGTEIAGAGMWYTRIVGRQAICDVAAPCNVHDLGIFGESTARDEQLNGVQKAFGGPQGIGSELSNLWIEHEVGGLWVGGDPPYQPQPTDKLHIHDVRIRDTYADGINLDNGTSNSLVENCHMRNTGDDAAVVWSVKWTKWATDKTYQDSSFIKDNAKDAPDQGIGHGNHFKHISVQMPWRANCFASYGGYDNWWEDSTCEDVLTYPGLFVDNEFSIYPFGSESSPAPQGPLVTTFNNISLIRAGGEMFYEAPAPGPAWNHGAIKLYLREGDVNDVLIENVDVIDPTYAGIEFRGFSTAVAQKYDWQPYPQLLTDADNAKFTNVTLKNVKVTGAGTYGISLMDLETGDRGSANLDGVTVSGSAQGALSLAGAPATFLKKVGTANQGW